MYPRKKKTNVWGLLLALGLPAACLIFVVPAMLSGNALFATDIIVQTPYEIVLYHDGQELSYLPGDVGYDLLLDASYEAIATQNGFNEWGWSERRFNQARTEGTAVEMFYSEPVKLPGSRVDVADVYRLFIPLEVFGASDANMVFRGGESEYWGAPLRLATLDPVYEIVTELTGDSFTAQ